MAALAIWVDCAVRARRVVASADVAIADRADTGAVAARPDRVPDCVGAAAATLRRVVVVRADVCGAELLVAVVFVRADVWDTDARGAELCPRDAASDTSGQAKHTQTAAIKMVCKILLIAYVGMIIKNAQPAQDKKRPLGVFLVISYKG